MTRFLILFMTLTILSCRKQNVEKTIVIQPFSNFEKEAVETVMQEIRKINPHVVLKKSIPFPTQSYYKPRNRYRADAIIRFLKSQVGADSIIVGLTNRDISTTKNGIKDWGVMGLGYRPGNACVVSSYRLKKNQMPDQLYKVVLHELGHTEGLPHCPIKTCLMRDAEGKIPLKDEKDFCSSCREYLKKKNWKL